MTDSDPRPATGHRQLRTAPATGVAEATGRPDGGTSIGDARPATPRIRSGSTDDLLRRIGERVRSARQSSGLTQRRLAERSGVSKRMLALIENGAGNASLATLDKVAGGLGVSFSELMSGPTQTGSDLVVRSSEVEALYTSETGSRGLLLVAATNAGLAELWDWTLTPGDSYDAEPDPSNSEELIQVRFGTLDVTVTDRVIRLAADDALRIPSDHPYSFRNPGLTSVRFIKVVVPSQVPPTDAQQHVTDVQQHGP